MLIPYKLNIHCTACLNLYPTFPPFSDYLKKNNAVALLRSMPSWFMLELWDRISKSQ